MDMKTVKAITINNNQVKKIENSNGDIIWGSYDAFPYRRLEYIQFNGAEYIDSGYNITQNDINTKVIEFKINISYQNITDWSVMGYDTSSGNTRFNIGVNGNGYSRIGIANLGTWQDSDGFQLALNTQYFNVVGYNANNSLKGYFWSQQLGMKQYNTYVLQPTGNLYIGAVNFDGNASNLSYTKIYRTELAVGAADNYKFMLYPCQRKSDGVCGLYDVINNVFRPMQGTNITSAAAGPVVDEYWDMTNPF